MLKRLQRMVPPVKGAIGMGDYTTALSAALERYSTDRPSIGLVYLSGSGPFAVPGDWSETSYITSIWAADYSRTYPVQMLALRPDGKLKRKGAELPETVHMGYARMHTLASVPSADHEAMLNWAAAYLLDILATHYTGDISPSISSDSVDHQSKGAAYASRARQCRQLYLDHLGIDPKKVQCAGAIITVRPSGSSGKTPLINRGRGNVLR